MRSPLPFAVFAASYLLLAFTCLSRQGRAFSPLNNRHVHATTFFFPPASQLSPVHPAISSKCQTTHGIALSADGASDEGHKEEKLGGLGQRIRSYFSGGEKDNGLTFKQRLGKMGLSTVLSYGFISNANAMALVASAWYVFSVKTKMSPLWPGQWKPFLTVYAGFYVVSNLMRPFRLTVAVAMGPYFDRLVNWIQKKTKLPKAGAVTAAVMLVNLGGTTLLMMGGISLASLLSGVPISPPGGFSLPSLLSIFSPKA